MSPSVNRVAFMVMRYLYLHKRSLPRTFEILFWPIMELFVWGFLSVYVQNVSQNSLAHVAFSLINAMIFWDILYRSQQGISISVVEDVWTQNILNLLISPLRLWEWLLSTFLYSVIKTFFTILVLCVLAFMLYHYNLIQQMHFYLLPLVFNLLLFGCALGIFTSSLVIRWGHAAEALIWGIPFLIQPLSAIFYPLSVMPAWLQWISLCLPSTYVFEGMRAVIHTGQMPMEFFIKALVLNFVYFAAAELFFKWMFEKARETGRLGRLGVD